MLKLRNSNTHIPQYETWAGTNDGLVTEAALLRAPTQEISLPVLLDTGHGITQIQSGPIQRFQLSHTAHNARPAAGHIQHWSSPTMQQGWGWAGAGATLSLHFFPLCWISEYCQWRFLVKLILTVRQAVRLGDSGQQRQPR